MLDSLEALPLTEGPAAYLKSLRSLMAAIVAFVSRATPDGPSPRPGGGLSSPGGARRPPARSPVGADMLMATLVLLLVHARLPQAYTALQYVKAVALPCDASSELGYVLCTFEGAVEFVRTCGPEAFQEPLEPIEEAGAEREPSGPGGL